MIVDVRNNGGGFLNSAVEIAELFVEKGKPIYGLQTKDKKVFSFLCMMVNNSSKETKRETNTQEKQNQKKAANTITSL